MCTSLTSLCFGLGAAGFCSWVHVKWVTDVSVELLPICSSRFRPGRKADEAHCLDEVVTQHIRRLVDPSVLEIETGEMVWSLHVTIYSLDHDGNMEDAVVLAAMSAIQDTRLPDVTSDGADGLHILGEVRSREIPFRDLILPVTFSLLDDRVALLDPTADEERMCDISVTVFVDREGKPRGLTKSGGRALSTDTLRKCTTTAIHRARQDLVALFRK